MKGVMTVPQDFTRDCPECGTVITYRNSMHLQRAIKVGTRCSFCARKKQLIFRDACEICKDKFTSNSTTRRTCEICIPNAAASSRYKLYNLTQPQFNALLKEQNFQCCLCDKSLIETKPHVDHNHNTDKVRGLLCCTCNIKLGGWDDENWKNRALRYLQQHS